MPAVAPQHRPSPHLPAPKEAPLLTIAVPTYNRARWLSRSLPEVLAQAGTQPAGQVEVLLSDNCSPDATWELLREAAAGHPFVRLNRNPQNLGPEGHFRLLPSLARGRYLWILGDDDVLLPGAVRRVTGLLSRGYEYVVLDFATYDHELAVCLSPSYFRISADLPLKNAAQAMRHVRFGASFISANVLRTDAAGNLTPDEHAFFSRWGMSFMVDVFAGIRPLRKGILCADPMLMCRRTESAELPGDFDYFEFFFEGLSLALEKLKGQYGYRSKDVRHVKRHLLCRVGWKRIAFERMHGNLNRTKAGEVLFRHYRTHLVFWLVCVPLIYLPGVGKAVRLAVSTLTRGHRRTRLLSGLPETPPEGT